MISMQLMAKREARERLRLQEILNFERMSGNSKASVLPEVPVACGCTDMLGI
jgi:hypothetical protein